jgi:hypothetical protein
MHESTTREKA